MYYEQIIINLVEKYENLHNGENMIANRMDASVLDSVMRKSQVSPKSHADFLHMTYDRVMQILRHYSINSQDRRDLMDSVLTRFSELLDRRLSYQQTPERNSQWKSSVQGLLDELRSERISMTRGFYLMALLKFCSDIRYRELFPTRQTWIYSL